MLKTIFTRMNSRSDETIHAIIHGDPNPRAIREYLKIDDSREVARLAASLAPKPQTFDPVALVDSAIALQVEAEIGLIRRRAQMVAEMNLQTLLQLAQKLDVHEKVFATHDEMFSDPIAGPVLQRIEQSEVRGDVRKRAYDPGG
jgi:hypothetical protein